MAFMMDKRALKKAVPRHLDSVDSSLCHQSNMYLSKSVIAIGCRMATLSSIDSFVLSPVALWLV